MSVIPALERGMLLAERLALSGRPWRYVELKRELGGISDASLNRLLSSLTASLYIAKDAEGRYVPAERLLAWGRILGSRFGLAATAEAMVDAAATRAEESAAFALFVQDRIEILASRSWPNSVTVIGPGELLHFEADHAASLAILDAVDAASPSLVPALLASPASRIATSEELERGLAACRRTGYWADESRSRPGISRIAVDYREGGAIAALFLCLPTVRLKEREADYAALLRSVAGSG